MKEDKMSTKYDLKLTDRGLYDRTDIEYLIDETYKVVERSHPYVVSKYDEFSNNSAESIIKDQIFTIMLEVKSSNPALAFQKWTTESASRTFIRTFGYDLTKPSSQHKTFDLTEHNPVVSELKGVGYKNKFKKNANVKYKGKDMKVSKVTTHWVELVDNRGFNQIVDFDDIKTFQNGKLVAESLDDQLEYVWSQKESNRILELAGMKETLEEKTIIPQALNVLKNKEAVAIGLVLLKFFHHNVKVAEDGLLLKLSKEHAIKFAAKDSKLRLSWYKGKIPKGKLGMSDVINAGQAFISKWNRKPITKRMTDKNSEFIIDLKHIQETLKHKAKKVGTKVKGTIRGNKEDN